MRKPTLIALVIIVAACCATCASAQTRLNNFVVELANVDLTAGAEAVSVTLERPEWLHIRLLGEGAAIVTVTADGADTAILSAPGETMRYLPAGEVTVAVAPGNGAALERLTVRRVPEIMVYMYEELTAVSPHGHIAHSWEGLEEAVLHSANLIVSHDREVYLPYAEAWQERGGRWLINQGMGALRDETVDLAQYWADLLGGRIWDGSIHDEVVSRDVEHFERYADGLARFRAMPESEGKTVYLYCGGSAAIGDPTLLDFYEPTDETAAEGERSIRATPQGDSNITARQMSVKLEPGVEYTISAQMRSAGSVSAAYSGIFIIDEGWHALYGRLRAPEGDTDWTRYSATFTPRPSSSGLYQVILVGPASGDLWLDAVQIERGAEATEFTTGERNVLQNPSFEDGLSKWMSGADVENVLRDAVIEHDHVFAPEIYVTEQETEERARTLIQQRLERVPAAWSRRYGVSPNALIVLSVGDCTLRYSNDHLPNVNYKVLLDMQMHAMAAGDSAPDLRGIGFWSAHYGSPEALRWYGALFRHYCIEGNTERLTDDPYLLDHLANPGFEEGLEGWETAGSVEAVAVADMPDRGARGRYAPVPQGAQVIRTVRAEGAAANSFTQAIRNLEPGRAYSVKLYCTDPQYAERLIPAQITIEGGEMLPEYQWENYWQVGGGGPQYWTMYRHVFRATAEQGRLTVADAEPGEVYWDFIQVERFFEGV
ncbi:MAG: hypothetical protein GX131_04575 [candidate division WS1 bacterium]|jgi:hypothetical protein|nr:hypothetical protein [candidate division WS1 bacterium]